MPVDRLGCPDAYNPAADSRRYFWRLAVEGRTAVQAFFRTRPDTASLGWCTRSGYGNATLPVT